MRKYLPLFIVLLFTLPAIRWFFGSGYYNMHDDLQVMRVVEMEKCLNDGQIPCRWSPDMAWGYGQAMYNFYSALPYYTGALIRILLPLSYLGTVKALFALAYLGAAIGMYILAREFWGKWGAIASSVLYTYAPYHALDIYVRGALAESFSLAILPFLWFYIYKLIKEPKNSNIVGVALSSAALFTTHNISTMVYAPVTVLWVIFWLISLKKFKSIFVLAAAGLLGAGLAAFFLLPALYEQKLIQIEHLTKEYSDYHGHFVTLKQLFWDRGWGDGPSIFGDTDDISFQIGWPHWWLTIPAVLLSVFYLLRRKIKFASLIIMLVGFGFLSAFLTHSRSLFLWEMLPKIQFVQFPWRFLGLAIFFFSFAGGSIVNVNKKLSTIIALIIISAAIVLNIRYTQPVHFSRLVKDEEKLQGVAWELQQKAAILDYLPKTAKMAPQSIVFVTPKFISGDGVVKNFDKKTNRFSFDADIYNKSEVEIPVMYFPGWKMFVDDKEVDVKLQGDYGLLKVELEPGAHQVFGRFTNTPVRSIGNVLSLIAGSFLFAMAVMIKKKND